MDSPQDLGTETKARQAQQIGMIHPTMQNVWLYLTQYAPQV
jgi:hypothetical protein